MTSLMEQNILKYHAMVIDKLFHAMSKNTRTCTATINIDLSHINEELNDTECLVEYESYKGTTEGNNSFDPSEIEVLSVKIKNEWECPALAGQEIAIDPIHDQVIEGLERV